MKNELLLGSILWLMIFTGLEQSQGVDTVTSCVQCNPSAPNDYEECLKGNNLPKACPPPKLSYGDAFSACITTVSMRQGTFVHISRGCITTSGKTDVWEGEEERTFYCRTNGCNNIDLTATATGSKNLKCLSCTGNETNTENQCNQKLGYDDKGPVTTLCPFKPCLYEVTRDRYTGRLLAVKRGCSEKSPAETLKLPNWCDDLTDGVKKCYCHHTECNRNKPEGIKCLQCRYSSKGCSEGTTKATLCSNFNFLEATGASCKETKVTDKATGKFMGYERECSAYRETICDGEGCYCNSNGCVKNKDNTINSVLRMTSNDDRYILFFVTITVIFGS